MKPEWPVRAEAPRVPARGRMALQRADAPARRIADAALDLVMEPRHRVDDRVRATATAMLDDLVDDIERAMRARLLPHFAGRAEVAASLGAGSLAIARPLLREAGLLADDALVAAVLRRAETFVLADRLAPERDGSGLPLDDADPNVAATAAALLVAEARRADRFGAPALPFDDLSAEVAHGLAWRIAAALRRWLRTRHVVEDAAVDAALTDAAAAVLGGHDEGQGLDAIAARLAARLYAGARLDGRMLVGWLEAGQVSAFTAGLAVAAGLPNGEAWHIVADPADGRLALALRAAGVTRDAAAAILLMLLPATRDAAVEVELFDACDADEAVDALGAVAADPTYRAAVRAIDVALGEGDAA